MHMAKWELLLILNIGLLIAGSFLEPPAAILILTPLLLPIVKPSASMRFTSASSSRSISVSACTRRHSD